MYRYKESGLDNVVLVNGYSEGDTPYGTMVSFDNIEGLHEAIGKWLLKLPRPLNGAEVRFLRHELDLFQKRLGLMLGVAEVTVRRWESNKDKPVPPTPDRFLRVIYSSWTEGRESTRELIDTLAGMDQAEAQVREEVRFRESHKGWRVDYGGGEAHS
ncbi:MAG: helix-turn-helix domain-containing protein [Rhodomicrobium sp.]